MKRVIFDYDPEPQHALESPVGTPLPESETDYYAENGACRRPDGSTMPYAEYCEYYGNPDRHIVLMVRVEEQCPTCDHWHTVADLYGIDMMDDDPGLCQLKLGTPISMDDAKALPGYLADCVEN